MKKSLQNYAFGFASRFPFCLNQLLTLNSLKGLISEHE